MYETLVGWSGIGSFFGGVDSGDHRLTPPEAKILEPKTSVKSKV